jgi:hypothetical protein
LVEVTNIVKALEELHKLPTIEFSSDDKGV